MSDTYSPGLEGVIAGETAISTVETGLTYRGYAIEDLAANSTYEEVAYLILYGELPTAQQAAAFRKRLGEAAVVPKEVIDTLRSIPREAPSMDVLRSAVSLLAHWEPETANGSHDANVRKAERLLAQVPVIVAARRRLKSGQQPVAADPALTLPANFLWMLRGQKPSEKQVQAMDVSLILYAEHEFNASTFSARCVVSTLSDLHSGIVAGIGALKGPLHGGANTEVLKSLMEIGDVKNVAGYVDSVRARKGKFMGFGHAVYQVEDPRARHLKELSRRLGLEQGQPKWYDISAELEHTVKEAIHKNCNVDFYSASLQHYMGIPGELFTCIFAASRIAGWCAHVLEQWEDNKIIRPSSNYTGPSERSYMPIDRR
jgi:citrate synthase